MYRFVVIEENVKGQIIGSAGVKRVEMLQSCWQWSQNVHQVSTIKKSKNQNSLPYVRCFGTMVTYSKEGQPMDTPIFSLQNMLHRENYSEFKLYLQDEHFETEDRSNYTFSETLQQEESIWFLTT